MISSEITFNDVDDYVTFEVTLKNNDDIEYLIEKISDNNKSKNINVTYSYEGKEIEKSGSKKITIKFTYNKKVEQNDVLSVDDVKITLDLVKEDGSLTRVVLNNPKTNDNILLYFVLFITSAVLIIFNISKKHIKKLIATLVIITLITPKIISATTDDKYEINISFNNAHINGTSITYSINIDEPIIDENKLYKVLFDSNGGKGELDSLEYKYSDKFELPSNPYVKYGYKFNGWNTKKDGSGKNYLAGEEVKKLTTEDEITLYANWENRTNGTLYEGTNIFNGKDGNVEGDASNNQSIDYLNTGIRPFSSENREKSFVLSFKISDFNLDRAKDKNNLDTIFTIVPNASDISQTNPGVTLRLRSGRWIFEVGNETDKLFSYSLPINDLINKEFKLIRINNGNTIKLYYSIDNQNPKFLKDLTNMNPNDAMLSFGATYFNEITHRYFEGKIDNISFKYYDDLTLGKFINDDYDESFPVVFKLTGPCTFNGDENTISGKECEAYGDSKFINTNVSLFSEENYKKDFEISFDISNYDPYDQSPSTIQQTFMNIKLEDESLGYPGIVVRKSAESIYIGAKDGKGNVSKNRTIKYVDASNVRIIKKDDIVYYSFNGESFKELLDMSQLDHTFDVPLYFGASSLPDGTPMRIVHATLSNMTIRMGKINGEIK